MNLLTAGYPRRRLLEAREVAPPEFLGTNGLKFKVQAKNKRHLSRLGLEALAPISLDGLLLY